MPTVPAAAPGGFSWQPAMSGEPLRSDDPPAEAAMRSLNGLPRVAVTARAASLVAAVAAYLLLLRRWFHDPGVALAGGHRVAAVWPYAVAALVLAGVAAALCRADLEPMRVELAAMLRLTRPRLFGLATVLVVSFVFQLPTMVFPAALLHSDASINGLMALHIADGRVAPAFYYGQEFMGTLFSHALALVFWFTGPFVAGTTMMTWVFYAGFLAGTLLLVCRAASGAVALAATLWLAVPPTTLIITLAQTEYAQLLVLSVWALVIVSARVAGPLQHDAWWIVAGGLLGLAFWAHPMASVVVAAVGTSMALMLRVRALVGAVVLLGSGFLVGLAPGLVGWGSRIGRFTEWFLAGGGRGDEGTLIEAVAGMARVSFGNLLLGTEGRQVLPWAIAGPLAAIVIASAIVLIVGGFRSRFDADRSAPDESADSHVAVVATTAAAAAVPLGLFVLLQLGILLGRGYAVTPTQYVVPLYLGVPAVVAIAVYRVAGRWSSRAGVLTAVAMLVWASVALPGSIAWLRALPENQASMNASIAALRAAGVEACIGPYWDAYRISYMTLEEIVCESIDVRRVPGYPERVAARSRPGRPAFIAAPQREDALRAHRESLDARGIGWTRLQTPRFLALLPRSR